MEWLDANGAFYRSRVYALQNTLITIQDPTAFLAAVTALCNAGLQQHTFNGATTFDAAAPNSGTAYDSVYQIGQVTYTTTAPNAVRVMLPGLLKTALLADGIVIDPTALAALDTAVLAFVTDNLGNAATVRTTAVLTDRRNDLQ
jgi:hypothetical protein